MTNTPVGSELAPPIVDPLPAMWSALEPVTISGQGDLGQTVHVVVNGVVVGEAIVGDDGRWAVEWQPAQAGAVTFEVMTVDSDGRAGPPVSGQVVLTVPRPRIDGPASGEVRMPGPVVFFGVAEPGVQVTLRDVTTGEVLRRTTTSERGEWQVEVTFSQTGTVTVEAVAAGPDGTSEVSEPVTITIAPVVQPLSGGNTLLDPQQAGRIFTVLLAVLFVSGGFSAFFAGRALFLLARDRFSNR